MSGNTVYAGGRFTQIGGQARSNLAASGRRHRGSQRLEPQCHRRCGYAGGERQYGLCGGEFNQIGGQARTYIAALDATSGLATAWNPSADNTVQTLVVSGNTVYAGGFFTQIGGQGRNYLASSTIAPATGSAYRLASPEARVYTAILPNHGLYESRVLGLEVQVDRDRLRFYAGTALLLESATS